MSRAKILLLALLVGSVAAGATAAAKKPAKCALRGYKVVYANENVRVLYRPRFKDYAVCNTARNRAYDLVGPSGERGRPHQAHRTSASGTPGINVGFSGIDASGHWLVFETAANQQKATAYLVAWNLQTGRVRTIFEASYRGASVDERYLLSDGTVVFSATSDAVTQTNPSDILYDSPTEGRKVLEEGPGFDGTYRPQPDPHSLAVADRPTGALAYWKVEDEVRTAVIPPAG